MTEKEEKKRKTQNASLIMHFLAVARDKPREAEEMPRARRSSGKHRTRLSMTDDCVTANTVLRSGLLWLVGFGMLAAWTSGSLELLACVGLSKGGDCDYYFQDLQGLHSTGPTKVRTWVVNLGADLGRRRSG